MTDISDDQVDELLRKAEKRLKDGAPSPSAAIVAATSAVPAAVEVKVRGLTDVSTTSRPKQDLTVREAAQPRTQTQAKDTAGPSHFFMPKTDLTPEFKRDWSLLRMRGVLDPKHQKKALRADPPLYSSVGEIIAGPTEFYSARLTRKERKGTLLEEAMSSHDGTKFATKYAGIQKQKASGKKGFYKEVVSRRRRNRN
ncbi:Fc.00g006310.m01.CDS01 [Cosmosporella sp. VM-42]